MDFVDLLKQRRSIYQLGNQVSLTNDELLSLIRTVVRESPSAFNSQTSRILILLDKAHQEFWDMTEHILKEVTPEAAFPNTQAKLAGFRSGKGTVLFYEDLDIVQELQNSFPLYADNFPIWAEHSSAIAQNNLWLALADQHMGANIQHYNPLIDDAVAGKWDIPKSWKLIAQMPFGTIEQAAGEKEYMEDEVRFNIHTS